MGEGVKWREIRWSSVSLWLSACPADNFIFIYFLHIPPLLPHIDFIWTHTVTATHLLSAGYALFLLLTFRTQAVYDRWWEGRKQLGSINSATRDIGRYCVSKHDQILLAATADHSQLCLLVALPAWDRVSRLLSLHAPLMLPKWACWAAYFASCCAFALSAFILHM